MIIKLIARMQRFDLKFRFTLFTSDLDTVAPPSTPTPSSIYRTLTYLITRS